MTPRERWAAEHDEPIAPGYRAPDFALARAGAAPIALADFQGRAVVLVCLRGPHDETLTEVFHDRPLPVIATTNDDVAARYGALDASSAFLIDGGGVVRWNSAGRPERNATARGSGNDLTRRQFIDTICAGAFTVSAAQTPAAAGSRTLQHPTHARDRLSITLHVNGRPLALTIESRVTLLDALRERAGLTGTKKGCDHGQCGACTVHIDGRRVLSCLTLAASVGDCVITTIEGLAPGGDLQPLQQAFIDCDGFQCGYCTPGQIMSGAALLGEPCGPSDADVREAMSGNLCRCGAYNGIIAAIQRVRGRARG